MKIEFLNKETIVKLICDLQNRNPENYSAQEAAVKTIVESVREKGDDALVSYTKEFDKVDILPEAFLVTEDEYMEAYEKSDAGFVEVLRKALANIRDFHEKQRQNSWFTCDEDGVILGQKVTPLERVGIYVPGGKAAYPSSVLMNIVPAKVAGVSEIIMVTPPQANGAVRPLTLVAAKEAGADKVYKVGGAQAIAALAFGTKTIPRVDKITGPGNIYVTLAKKAVFGSVAIDAIAGPSEILVIADKSANPKFIAADLLSQAEHDELACAILITTDKSLANEVCRLVDEEMTQAPRKDIIEKSIENYGLILIADNLEEAINAANEVASEHLELHVENPFEAMTKIKNAGAIFIGDYSCEPVGDYYAGPNHVLPTNRTARFFSPLSVDDFIKKSSIISYSKEALEKTWKDIDLFAKEEGLYAHARSVEVRFED
ncbi:MAG: histidinol dehydrogenase [Lachnospiraceae bacterium]|jgi:histidinol dehydrogenase|nr:histidinol dehydrogenase [Lachnospiraceae bacterium]